MKQHVTPKQLQEVSKEKLVEIYGDKYGSKLNDYRKDFYEYHHKKFTIGKMIEILQNSNKGQKKLLSILGFEYNQRLTTGRLKGYCLCDSLWEAIKECL